MSGIILSLFYLYLLLLLLSGVPFENGYIFSSIFGFMYFVCCSVKSIVEVVVIIAVAGR